jgi:hypothetical protein
MIVMTPLVEEPLDCLVDKSQPERLDVIGERGPARSPS